MTSNRGVNDTVASPKMAICRRSYDRSEKKSTSRGARSPVVGIPDASSKPETGSVCP
ncbi:hypothetical protein D3C83_129480 [compost metagenome]